MLTLVLTDFEDRDNVRMREAGCGFGFGFETFYQNGSGECARADEFKCNHSIQAHLPRFKNDSHSASRELLQQFVITEVSLLAIDEGGYWNERSPWFFRHRRVDRHCG